MLAFFVVDVVVMFSLNSNMCAPAIQWTWCMPRDLLPVSNCLNTLSTLSIGERRRRWRKNVANAWHDGNEEQVLETVHAYEWNYDAFLWCFGCNWEQCLCMKHAFNINCYIGQTVDNNSTVHILKTPQTMLSEWLKNISTAILSFSHSPSFLAEYMLIFENYTFFYVKRYDIQSLTARHAQVLLDFFSFHFDIFLFYFNSFTSLSDKSCVAHIFYDPR